MPQIPSISKSAERGFLPSATVQSRGATGADFGGQIGAAVQQAGSAVQDLSQSVEKAELLRAADQKRLRDFTLTTNLIEFAAGEQAQLTQAADQIESGGWEFQRTFVAGFDQRAEEWFVANGIEDPEEKAEYRQRMAQQRQPLSQAALVTELGERRRFGVARTNESLDVLMTSIDRTPGDFEALVDRGQAVIDAAPVGQAIKEQMSQKWQHDAALAYGTNLVSRDADGALAALGGVTTQEGEYTGDGATNEVESYIFSTVRNAGFSDVAAAAVTGTFSHEGAGANPNARNPGDGADGSDSIGFGQWNGPRAVALKAFAAEKGLAWNTKEAQTAFFLHEVKTGDPGAREAYRRLQAATTIEEAVEAMNYYERPQGFRSGGDPTAVLGWEDRVARAERVAGSRAAETSPPSAAADPRLANLTYEDRIRLRGQAERGIQVQQQQVQQQQQEQHQSKLNALQLGLIDGTAGAEDIAIARAEGWLTDASEIAQVNNIVAQQQRQTVDINLFNAGMAQEDYQWNPYDPAAKAAVDAGFRANPTFENLQTILTRTGMVPESASSAIRGQLLNRDPAVVEQAAMQASLILARSPNAFTAVEGGSDIARAGTMFDYYVNDLGWTAEQAGERIAAANDPQRPGRPADPELHAFTTETRATVSAAQIIDRMAGGRGRVLGRVQELTLIEDYNTIATENFRLYGDAAAARNAAQKEINRLYGISANGTFTKYPPENIYPADTDGGHDYIYSQAANRVKLNAELDVNPRDVFLVPLPTVTAEAWRRGEPPAYAIGYVHEVDGQRVYDVLPGSWRFNPPEGARAPNNREQFDQRYGAVQQGRRNIRENTTQALSAAAEFQAANAGR